ncbi:U32 family peptidase [Shewanella sp. GXUN23E]|uniref:U32 family peptidase n=1 Tax=Shewanella sp. GXUN23E TaxID=3422498 RepID=UPI003D7D8071
MYHKNQFELLAPGGDLDAIKAAIVAGADAVYCGLDRFNARNRATNITLDLLDGVVSLAHAHNCKIFLTLNIMLLESELPAMVRLLSQLQQTEIDGVIVQDLGLARLIRRHFPSMDMHASTQMNTHNQAQMSLLHELGMSRANLSRELSLDEIAPLARHGHDIGMLTEVFVHGSYCVGFSGVCYLSSARNGASGNRGRCSQPCREAYKPTAAGKQYPLNMKDNSAFHDLPALAEAGVYSLKIEGRIKKSHYVFTAVDSWRQQIDALCAGRAPAQDMSSLYRVFNRDFSNGYLHGNIHGGMFIDNPRDHAPHHFAALAQTDSPQAFKQVKQSLYQSKTEIIQRVERLTADMQVSESRVRSVKGKETDIPLPRGGQAPAGVPELVVLLGSDDLALEWPALPGTRYMLMLPDALADNLNESEEFLLSRPGLIPCFPAVMTDTHLQAARALLEHCRPAWLMTHNLGVAQLARELGIPWVAGAQLNISNSLALQCLQEDLQAMGAVISKELSGKQLARIVRPDAGMLMGTLYEPNLLMTSRQCLLMQAVGCRKQRMNAGCLKRCSKSATLENLKDEPYLLHKDRGSYNRLYSHLHTLNLPLLSEHGDRFTHLLVDLRQVPTGTQLPWSRPESVSVFARAVGGDKDALQLLGEQFGRVRNRHYELGV